MPVAEKDARFWDRFARKYAASRIADVAGYERTLARTREHLKPSDTVLEFGCGTGTTALKLAPAVARYLATDIAPEMIAIAREKAQATPAPTAEFEVATLDAAHWPEGAFDAVLGFNVLHLLDAPEEALMRVHRLLKSDGLFISKTPCLKEMNPVIRLVLPLMQAVGQAPHVSLFNAEELERQIEAASFEIVVRERHASRGKDARIFLVARKM